MTVPEQAPDSKILKKDNTPFRFLLVDDSAFIINSLTLVVKLLGGEVVGTANDGAQCIDVYKKVRPDIVTCDIVMPNMTGIEAVKQLMQIDPNAIIIMVSSLGHKEMVTEAIKLGAKYFIVKPFKPIVAAVTLKKVISSIFKL